MKNMFPFCLIILLLTACEESSIQTESSTAIDSSFVNSAERKQKDTLMLGGIKLYPLTDSPEFNDAILRLNSPGENFLIKDGKVLFNYEIKNYQLAQPTMEGSCAIHCANSDQGQHIHLILNNEPYLAKYSTEFTEALKPGHYVALSFLSRSYHESIKHYEAYDLRQFTVGKVEEQKVDLTKPMLFYSRPKGEYKGKETRKVLLDFYVINANLAPKEYKVKATINGNEFMLSSWKGYLMEGLPMGENTIKLELLDSKGNVVEGPYSTTERKITLLEEPVN